MALVDIRFGSGPVPTTGRPVIIRKKNIRSNLIIFTIFYSCIH